MPADDILLDSEERMEKAVDVFKHAMAGIRTGRANPGLVDSLRVEAYGAASADEVAGPSRLPRSRRKSSSGHSIRQRSKTSRKRSAPAISVFNPQNDGRVIRINIPPLSTDVRRKLVARIKDLGEEAKVSIRNVRRDSNKAADQEQKDKVLTEDERDALKDEIQELTKKYEAKIADLAKAKEAEVMEN